MQNFVVANRISGQVYQLHCFNSILFRAGETTEIIITNFQCDQQEKIEFNWTNNNMGGQDMVFSNIVSSSIDGKSTLVKLDLCGQHDICFWQSELLAIITVK